MKRIIIVVFSLVLTTLFVSFSILEKNVESNVIPITMKAIVNPVYVDESLDNIAYEICSFDGTSLDSFEKETIYGCYYAYKLLNGNYCYIQEFNGELVLAIHLPNNVIRISIDWVPEQIIEWDNAIYLKYRNALYFVDLQNEEINIFKQLTRANIKAGTVHAKEKLIAYTDSNNLYIITDNEEFQFKTKAHCLGVVSDDCVLMSRCFFGFFELIYKYNIYTHTITNIILCASHGRILKSTLSSDANYLLYVVFEGFDTPPTLRLLDLKTRERLILDNMDEFWKISSLQLL